MVAGRRMWKREWEARKNTAPELAVAEAKVTAFSMQLQERCPGLEVYAKLLYDELGIDDLQDVRDLMRFNYETDKFRDAGFGAAQIDSLQAAAKAPSYCLK